jgi:hypothetical protein
MFETLIVPFFYISMFETLIVPFFSIVRKGHNQGCAYLG